LPKEIIEACRAALVDGSLEVDLKALAARF